MAYRKRSSRKIFRRKRKRTRRMYTRGKKRARNQNFFQVKLTVPTDDLTNSATAEATDGYRISLDGADNQQHYRQQWDQYRIDKVRITWTPVRTQQVVTQVIDTTNPQSVTNVPMYYTALDRDNIVNIDVQNTKQRFGARSALATQKMTRTFVPTVLTAIEGSSQMDLAFATRRKVWIDSTYSKVPHYGVRAAMEAAAPSGIYRLKVDFEVWISFRNRMI